MYLPQFHQIPENDEFWGKGFTDWVTVRKAVPLFQGHQQPRVPLNNNYYDLSKPENVEWQAKLAHDHGIYGFGVYHYWFNNDKNILTRPAEILRDSKNGYVKYFLTWDNTNWKRSWSNVDGNDWAPLADNPKEKKGGVKILIPYILGHELDWENHYNYCRTHFHSNNYEKVDNKPVFAITGYSNAIGEMCLYWDKLAKKDGFDGMYFVIQYMPYHRIPSDAATYRYEPSFSGWNNLTFAQRVARKLLKKAHLYNKTQKKYTIFDYDVIWKQIIKNAYKYKAVNYLPGAFVDYDDSPRRGLKNSLIVLGATPEKFKSYFKRLFDISKAQGKPYILLTAWNEWGEGAYLEPDNRYGLRYLNAISEIVKD